MNVQMTTRRTKISHNFGINSQNDVFKSSQFHFQFCFFSLSISNWKSSHANKKYAIWCKMRHKKIEIVILIHQRCLIPFNEIDFRCEKNKYHEILFGIRLCHWVYSPSDYTLFTLQPTKNKMSTMNLAPTHGTRMYTFWWWWRWSICCVYSVNTDVCSFLLLLLFFYE